MADTSGGGAEAQTAVKLRDYFAAHALPSLVAGVGLRGVVDRLVVRDTECGSMAEYDGDDDDDERGGRMVDDGGGDDEPYVPRFQPQYVVTASTVAARVAKAAYLVADAMLEERAGRSVVDAVAVDHAESEAEAEAEHGAISILRALRVAGALEPVSETPLGTVAQQVNRATASARALLDTLEALEGGA